MITRIPYPLELQEVSNGGSSRDLHHFGIQYAYNRANPKNHLNNERYNR